MIVLKSVRKKVAVRSKINRNSILRISIFKSSRHFYVQLIDDAKGITLTSASTLDAGIREKCSNRVNRSTVIEVAQLFFLRISALSLDKKLVFDRGSYRYTGVIASFADQLRRYGLNF